MTTRSWSTVFSMATDADFRAWGAEMNSYLSQIGLVQTSDTGQINWATVARAAVSTMAGYEIWRFDDSLQATAPIYIKIEYGSGSNNTTRTQFAITVGTGTNGAGTLTGTTSTRRQCDSSSSNLTNIGSYQSWACCVPGAAWMMFKSAVYANTNPAFFFKVQRYNDPDGTPNGNGFVVYCGPQQSTAVGHAQVQSVRTAATAIVFTADTAGQYAWTSHNDLANGTTTDAGEIQVFSHWAPTRKQMQLFGICSVLKTEISEGSTFTTAVIGTTPRTYIVIAGAIYAGAQIGANGRLAPIWE